MDDNSESSAHDSDQIEQNEENSLVENKIASENDNDNSIETKSKQKKNLYLVSNEGDNEANQNEEIDQGEAEVEVEGEAEAEAEGEAEENLVVGSNEGGEEEAKIGEITYDKDGEEPEEASAKRKKHKKERRERKRSKLEKLKKKQRTENDSIDKMISGDEVGDDNRDDDELLDSDHESKKKKKNKQKDKRKTKKTLEAEASREEVSHLLQIMEDAYKLDLEMNEKRLPALNKLKALPEVESIIRKKANQETFLEKEGLDMLEAWLKKMPDGSHPSQTLKKKLVEIISYLPANYEHIRSTKLGKLLFEMQKNQAEDPATKKQVKDIITKWSRILLEMPADYTYMRDNEEDRGDKTDRIKMNMQKNNIAQIKISNPTSKPKIVRTGFDFVKRPAQSDIDRATKRSASSLPSDDFEKSILDIKKGMKAKARRS